MKSKDEMPDLDTTPPKVAPKGAEAIRSYLPRLADKPGVYRMIGADGDVLYVGKARSLKKRVASYAKMTGHTNRIMRMILATETMEFVTTETETEALLLEANLIKQLKPRYNVLLRDDKSFPHILIEDGPFPLIRKHRGARREKGRYFGPFASAGAVNRTLNQMQKAFFAAHLLRLGLRVPDAPLPAFPDQTLFSALHG